MNTTRKLQKALVLSLGLALTLPVGLLAQGTTYSPNSTFYEGSAARQDYFDNSENLSALFELLKFSESSGGSRGSVSDWNLSNETFGTPLGGGVFILIGGALGYAAMKRRKEDEK